MLLVFYILKNVIYYEGLQTNKWKIQSTASENKGTKYVEIKFFVLLI